MNEYELIDKARAFLNNAEVAINLDSHTQYCESMSDLLDFLMVELAGGASNETQTRIDNYRSTF